MDEKKDGVVIHISTKSFLKAVGVIAAVFLLWFVSDILIILFLALILAALIEPFADWAAKQKIPRAITVLVVYIGLFAVLSIMVSMVVPLVTVELSAFLKNFNDQLRQWLPTWVDIQSAIDGLGIARESVTTLGPGIGSAAKGAFSTIRGVIGNVITFVLVLVMAFYIVVEEKAVKRMVKAVLPENKFNTFSVLMEKVQEKIGAWLRGQLFLMLVIGVLTYVGLLILGVKHALVLGLFAGIMEFVPYIGPIIAIIPAVLIALTDSTIKAGLVILLGIIIQQAENHLLVPKIMQRAVGLNPLISILSVLIGFKVGGPIGALLAIPVATSVAVFVQDYTALRRARENL